MKLTVLCDNNTRIDAYYLGEPGVCYYLEDGDARILMDTGYSDVFARNAQALGIDLTQLTGLVLSHGHDDHTGGMVHLPLLERRLPLYAHPQVFGAKRCDGISIGAPMTTEEAGKRFDLHLTRGPQKISEHLTLLGEIPRENDFESKEPIGERFVKNVWEPDYLWDDTAIACQGEKGLTIITGCSHAGIVNITEYAKKVCGDDRICGIIGGFHLLSETMDRQTERTVDWLRWLKPENLRPCHCTGFYARAAIHAATPIKETCVGDVIEF